MNGAVLATPQAPSATGDPAVAQHVRAFDRDRVRAQLDAGGFSVLEGLLAPDACDAIAALDASGTHFRSRVVMERHGYGRGQYGYFRYPLPEPIAPLRSAVYAQLAPVADSWQERLGSSIRFPATLPEFLAECHRAGQRRPTPLLLRYGPGDYNRLHRDLYGEIVFPLQMAVLLGDALRDFSGGEFVLTEQRARMQTRVDVVPLRQADAVLFAVDSRPVRGVRGECRVRMRHGVSVVRHGTRLAAGVIFHDAA